jgi:hypothetical protein
VDDVALFTVSEAVVIKDCNGKELRASVNPY